MTENSGSQPSTSDSLLEREEVLRGSGSFLFGVVGYATLIAIPVVFGSVIIEYVESEIASLLLFTVVVVLAVAFLYRSSVKPSIFLGFASIGTLAAYGLGWIFFGPSPVFPVLFIAFIGLLALGTIIYVGLSRENTVTSLRDW